LHKSLAEVQKLVRPHFRCRIALMNFAKAAISSAIALISKATVMIFMVFLLILSALIGVT